MAKLNIHSNTDEFLLASNEDLIAHTSSFTKVMDPKHPLNHFHADKIYMHLDGRGLTEQALQIDEWFGELYRALPEKSTS